MCDPKVQWAVRSCGPRLTHTKTGVFPTKLIIIYVFICVLALVCSGNSEGLVLSEHIRHFEPVFYDSRQLHHHHRTKRDASDVIPLDFTAHNQEFRVRLKKDRSIFTDDVVFESTNGPVKFDVDKVYVGTLEDDDMVEVQGIINSDGIFDGHIATPNELFYLEPANRYLTNTEFHSVMYKASDVVGPKPASCASQQLHQRGKVHNPWVDNIGSLYEPNGLPTGPSKDPLIQTPSIASNLVRDVPSHIHPKFKAVNHGDKLPSNHLHNHHHHHSNSSQNYHRKRLYRSKGPGRSRRALVDQRKTTCMLYLQADHLFYKEEGTEEACIDKITRHVQRVNNIYKVTDFNRDGRPDNIGFMIKRIKIHNENATRDPTYRFPGNYGVEKFLELFSEEDYDAFCLAYMFTYRDFEGGTLGLAWTGDLKNAGGVCEKNGHYRGSLKSLNTGIVTLLNYGKKVPPAVSHVTLAHEIGHNFGSPHDPEEDLRCTPGGEDGNYIMFARATSGDKQNNNRFSPCSLKQINSVLNSKARDTKGCFTEPQSSICGNGVVEDGEECDCGWQEDCDESCCFPMVSNPKPHEPPCTLRAGKLCSPSQGPCCTQDCGIKHGELCRDDNGCRDPQYCDGRSPYCPPSLNKPNKTICKEEFVCFRGECTGSICLAYGLESCQCERKYGDPETKSCELCCKHAGENQSCLSSFEWNSAPYNIPDMYAKPGTPCDKYKGYCDVFQKCREVDPSGPLATLRDILLSNESLANLQRWIIEHWYAVLFVLLTLLVILLAIMKVFGKRAAAVKSTSHSRKKAKRSKVIVHKNNGSPGFLTTTNGTTVEGPTHVIHPTVVRANIPFKRRVNEVKRAATKAKRVAKSQLGRPYKKSTKRPDGGVTSPTDSDKSIHAGKISSSSSPVKRPSKSHMSSRFSIISFKPFKPKSTNPDKKKLKPNDLKKSSTYVIRKTKTKVKASPRNRSPDKKTRDEKTSRKRHSLEDDKRKLKHGKGESKSSPDKSRKGRKSSTMPNQYDGNWLINKFLEDEENVPKPVLKGSPNGSPKSTLNESPVIAHHRSDSKRALIGKSSHASPVRGIVNAAFVSSPRGKRTHSSLKAPKNLSPDEIFDNTPCKYRRSISMEAYSKQAIGLDKRKRSQVDPRDHVEKRKRVLSPDKAERRPRPQSLAEGEKHIELEAKTKDDLAFKELRLPNQIKGLSSKSRNKSSTSLGVPDTSRPPTTTRRNSISLPSSKNRSCSSVPEKLKEKLSLISVSPTGSLTSIVLPESSSLKDQPDIQNSPKDWV